MPDSPRKIGAEWPQRDLTQLLHSGAFVANCGHKLPARWLGSAPDQQESSACHLWSSLSQSKKWQERIQSHLVLVSLKEQFSYNKHRPGGGGDRWLSVSLSLPSLPGSHHTFPQPVVEIVSRNCVGGTGSFSFQVIVCFFSTHGSMKRSKSLWADRPASESQSGGFFSAALWEFLSCLRAGLSSSAQRG